MMCSKCHLDKSEEEFYKRTYVRRGRHSWCIPCCKVGLEEHKQRHPERFKLLEFFRMTKYRYGVSREDYETLLEEQGHRCGICKEEFSENRRPSLDHNHGTKVPRGILCSNCNCMIGYAKERRSTLESAVIYLTKHKA